MRLSGVMRSTFRSLWTRNFRLFFLGQLVSNSGNWLTNVALVLLILHLTKSGLAVGLVAACQYGPILLLSAWAGVIADRSNKRHLLMLTQSLEMLQSFALGALAFMPHPPVAGLFVTAAAGGVLLAFDNPVRRSFVTEMVSEENVPNAVTLYSAMVNTSRIIGPAVAGALVVTLGYGWAFTFDAISYTVVLWALKAMRTEELRKIPATPRAPGQVRAGIRYVASRADLWIPFVMLGVIGVFSYNFTVVLPLFVERSLGGSDATFTAVYAVFSVGALAGALVAAHRATVRLRQVIVGSLALGVAMLGLAVAPSVAITYAVVAVVGIASIVYMTSTTALVQVRADPRMHGRVLALQTVLLIGTTPIGGPIAGAIADAIGARAPIVVGGVAAVAAGLWAILAARHSAQSPRPSPGSGCSSGTGGPAPGAIGSGSTNR